MGELTVAMRNLGSLALKVANSSVDYTIFRAGGKAHDVAVRDDGSHGGSDGGEGDEDEGRELHDGDDECR